MSTKADSLRDVPLFADLSRRDLRLLTALVKRVRETRARDVAAAG